MVSVSNYIITKLEQFIKKEHRIPHYFIPYNCTEELEYCCTLGTQSGSPGHIGNLLIIELRGNNE